MKSFCRFDLRKCWCFFVCLLVLQSGCAVGPLVHHETARTVGKGGYEIVGGTGLGGYVAKFNVGITENLDVGVHWESLSIGVRAKYAFFQQSAGWSLAAAAGVGSSIGGSHSYADLIASHKTGEWEPYALVRAVRVSTDPSEFRDEDTGRLEWQVRGTSFGYGQGLLGTRYWLSDHWLFSFEVSTLFAMSSSVTIDDSLLAGIAFGYRY